jgi:hypothetical protein
MIRPQATYDATYDAVASTIQRMMQLRAYARAFLFICAEAGVDLGYNITPPGLQHYPPHTKQ